MSEDQPEPEPESLEHSAASGAFLTVSLNPRTGDEDVLVTPPTLRVFEGADAGKSFRATSERLVVGTHPSVELCLSDPAVSRFHCEIRVESDHVKLIDLGSRNGTFVDGVRIERARLKEGAVLEIGRSKLRFGLDSTPVNLAVAERDRFGALVGRSIAMRSVFALFERAAETDATVLLTGETGTGKEVAAESIHAASPRKNGPFVVVDCGAIPRELMESELFGHERGAFTGAVAARAGAFEVASGGTIFLDEIGELDLDLQPKLLRALESRQFKRVGSTRYVPVDVRVIAATNVNLREQVNARRFRPDLYYRLAVIEVRMPALRERPDDLPLLVEAILAALGATDRAEAGLLETPAALAELSTHPWPGNVRELRNYVERCLALAQRQPLASTDGTRAGDKPPASLRSARERALLAFEKQYLEALLEHHDGNVSAAARTAGIDRKYLYKLLWKHGLR